MSSADSQNNDDNNNRNHNNRYNNRNNAISNLIQNVNSKSLTIQNKGQNSVNFIRNVGPRSVGDRYTLVRAWQDMKNKCRETHEIEVNKESEENSGNNECSGKNENSRNKGITGGNIVSLWVPSGTVVTYRSTRSMFRDIVYERQYDQFDQRDHRQYNRQQNERQRKRLTNASRTLDN